MDNFNTTIIPVFSTHHADALSEDLAGGVIPVEVPGVLHGVLPTERLLVTHSGPSQTPGDAGFKRVMDLGSRWVGNGLWTSNTKELV